MCFHKSGSVGGVLGKPGAPTRRPACLWQDACRKTLRRGLQPEPQGVGLGMGGREEIMRPKGAPGGWSGLPSAIRYSLLIWNDLSNLFQIPSRSVPPPTLI